MLNKCPPMPPKLNRRRAQEVLSRIDQILAWEARHENERDTRFDRHRGGGHPPTPATPPCVRVRTRRFELVTLASIDQRWKSKRFEVGIGKPHREGFGPGQIPGTESAASRVIGQSRANPQREQSRSATAWCFPLPPHSGSQSEPDPAGQLNQHIGRFAEAEIAAPTSHIRSQLRYRRFQADAFRPTCDFPDAVLKPLQSLRRNGALDLWTVCKAEPEKLPLLRSRHRALRLIYLEFELVCDESRNALHHPLTRPLAAHVDIAIIGVAQIAVATSLELSVEFVEHEVRQQWRKWASLGSAFHAWADQSVLHHPGIQECPNEFQQPLVFDSLGDLPHQLVVMDSIKELLQVEINHPAVAFCDVLLRLGYRLMG